MHSIFLSSGQVFTSDTNESLLDAATKAGVAMAYSCRTGRCSSCKCKVISGQSVTLVDEQGLTAEEKANGWVLSCVRSASSDMQLDVSDFGAFALPPVKTLPCRIQSLELVANDVMKVVLRLPPSESFPFFAGQYIDITSPTGHRRSYSIASPPNQPHPVHLELHVRAVQGGRMSEYWFEHAKVNDLLRLKGPLGTFFLRQVAGTDLIFLATGTGIAPVKSILESMKDMPDEEKPRSVSVYWGGRTPGDIYWEATDIFGMTRFIPVLSRKHDGWKGNYGYVQNTLLECQPDLSNAAVYACGSSAMIQSAKDSLCVKGLSHSRFFSDAFVCSASV